MSARDPSNPYVSRGGLKLSHALSTFALDVTGLVCADLGASTGGFSDCLLQAGASRVYSVDTAYGEFAWKLRKDPRVEVMERTNALYASPPDPGVDLVVADLGWTPQRLLVPAARRWLRDGGRIISLVKPHYEASGARGEVGRGKRGILDESEAEAVARRAVADLPPLGVEVLGLTKSPVLGGSRGKGNAEWLVLLALAPLPPEPPPVHEPTPPLNADNDPQAMSHPPA